MLLKRQRKYARDVFGTPGLVTGGRRRRWTRPVALLLIAPIMLVNSIAWIQTWDMTHFAAARTAAPQLESLSPLQKAWLLVTGVPVARPSNERTPRAVGLAYEVRQIPVGTGESLEAWWMPQTRPRGLVLLFHGYAASKESLLPAATVFHDLGYAALAVDFRGSGGSSGQDTTLGVREATDVAQTVAYAQRTWPDQPLVLFGVSMGSAAVLRAIAQEGVRPSAVILESPFARLLTSVGNRFRAMGAPAFPGAELMVFWGSVQNGFDGFADNPEDDAPAVQCPVLVLHGAQDIVASTDDAKTVFARLAGPKQFVVFPNAGHEILQTTPLSAWRAPVAEFLAGLPVHP